MEIRLGGNRHASIRFRQGNENRVIMEMNFESNTWNLNMIFLY